MLPVEYLPDAVVVLALAASVLVDARARRHAVRPTLPSPRLASPLTAHARPCVFPVGCAICDPR